MSARDQATAFGIDLALLEANLRLTPHERLAELEEVSRARLGARPPRDTDLEAILDRFQRRLQRPLERRVERAHPRPCAQRLLLPCADVPPAIGW